MEGRVNPPAPGVEIRPSRIGGGYLNHSATPADRRSVSQVWRQIIVVNLWISSVEITFCRVLRADLINISNTVI